MRVIDNRSRGKSELFSAMMVGTTFLNANGDVCIKVSESQWFNFRANKLIDVGVIPIPYELLNAELVIQDTKERGKQ